MTRKILIAILLLMMLKPSLVIAQPNIHLVGIANGDYSAEAKSQGQISLPDTGWSASAVINLMKKQIGASSATILESTSDKLISKADVFALLDDIEQSVKSTPGDDFIFLYYIGHGYGEGIGCNQFLLPGDRYLIDTDINLNNLASLDNQMIHVGSVVNKLEKMNSQFIFLVDTCYEGTERNFTQTLLNSDAEQGLNDVLSGLRFLNEFRGPNPVVFASEPGNFALTVPYPSGTATDGIERPNVGPLARRTIKYLKAQNGKKNLPIVDFISALKSDTFDDLTPPAISFPDWGTTSSFVTSISERSEIKFQKGSSNPLSGKAITVVIDSIEGDETPTPETPSIQTATIKLFGSANEYISDGLNHQFDESNSNFLVSEFSDRELSIEVQFNSQNWTLNFAVPKDRRFEKGTFRNVTRYGFHENNQNALEISGDGRGCGELKGSFEVAEVKYFESALSQISVIFEQYCDDADEKLSGTININFL